MKVFITTLLLMTYCLTSAQDFNTGTSTIEIMHQNMGASTQVNEIECFENSFWSLDAIGNIFQWQINNGMISFMDTVLQNTPTTSLAFADSMNPSSIPRTFYGSDGHNLMYYNGSTWILPSVIQNNNWIGNCSGFHNYLFYTAFLSSGIPDRIVRFDGTNVTTIAALNNYRNFTIADLAVDNNGDILIMSGIFVAADTLMRFSSNGTLLNTYPITLDCSHAYGAFMLNDVYYIGFGNSNPTYPNTIVSIGFNSSGAFIQNVLPMPQNNYLDLASCSPGRMAELSTHELLLSKLFSIYPNPSSGETRITLSASLHYPVRISVSDMLGKEIWSEKFSGSENISIGDLPAGIYNVSADGYSFVQKLFVTK